jgi:hypothetical protein
MNLNLDFGLIIARLTVPVLNSNVKTDDLTI